MFGIERLKRGETDENNGLIKFKSIFSAEMGQGSHFGKRETRMVEFSLKIRGQSYKTFYTLGWCKIKCLKCCFNPEKKCKPNKKVQTEVEYM